MGRKGNNIERNATRKEIKGNGNEMERNGKDTNKGI